MVDLVVEIVNMADWFDEAGCVGTGILGEVIFCLDAIFLINASND